MSHRNCPGSKTLSYAVCLGLPQHRGLNQSQLWEASTICLSKLVSRMRGVSRKRRIWYVRLVTPSCMYELTPNVWMCFCVGQTYSCSTLWSHTLASCFCLALENDDMVMQTMLDLFARKSTSTIRTRAGSFAMYIAWALKSHPDDPVFPIEESKIYSYACACRVEGRSASRIDTLLGTLRYVGGEFGFTGAESAARSPRVVGAAHSMLLNRPPRRRAESLTPSMIAWFEIACFAMPDAYDRVIAGMCMLCCMGRLRCSDANRVRHAGLVGRFIEGALSRTKTSRSKEKATTFIPLVVPSFGVLGRPWFIEFVKAREQLGLRAIPSLRSKSHDLTFLMVPEHASIVYDMQEPLSAGELTGRMRSILAMGYGASDLEGISSHSPEGDSSCLHEYVWMWPHNEWVVGVPCQQGT